MQALNTNLKEIIIRYCNTHAKNQYCDVTEQKEDEDKGDVIRHSKTL